MSSESPVPGREPGTSDAHPASRSVETALPPPAYSDQYGSMDLHQRGFGTNAQVSDDGRVDINIKQRERKLSKLLGSVIPPLPKPHAQDIPSSLTGEGPIGPIPRLNIVIQIVGSRGDVQPFVALGRVLKEKYGHRVRLATHSTFRQFVEDHQLEFFSIGVDPADLMAFMVKNPGLLPGIDALRTGDIRKRRREIAEIVSGCWRSCFEAGDGTGLAVSDADIPNSCPRNADPFVADVIIANPPSFAHIHCAEKLGIPLHLMFTMPWSPTQAFPHPLANIVFSNTEPGMTNFISYALVEMLIWQGLADIINKFREKSLGLEPLSVMWAPGILPRLRIPFTYCWSPALLPKPKDWGSNIDISGFFFLSSGSNCTPPDDLAAFLAAGPPPVYIGFGSIVVDNPTAMTKLIFEAIKMTGQRAIISHGWGGLGVEELGIPEGVFMIGSCPHDWLFKQVSCVVHHGGAGTTAIGVACGRPTVVIPFFGDQQFWGSIVMKAGAGPAPIPHKQLTADKLSAAILKALEVETQQRATELAASISHEAGLDSGVDSFHRQLGVDKLRCMLSPSRCAVWRVRRTKIRLSAFAATVLSNEGILDLEDIKLYRPVEYDIEPGPRDPVTGGAAALIGSLVDFTMGFADIPAEILRAIPFPPFSTGKPRSRDASPGPQRSSSRGSLPPSRDSSVVSLDRNTPIVHQATAASDPTHEIRDDDQLSSISVGSDATLESRTARQKEKISEITAKEMVAAGLAASKLFVVGLKSPMTFAMNIAKGLHNAPKLYRDRSVRETEKITGISSGVRAAGKEFGYGFYDGISGLVTQPFEGRSEGATGVIKGIGKGIGGLILKPGAGIFALAGYTLNGVYKEVTKLFGTSVEAYILASRSKQGYDEWKQSSKEEREEVLQRWYALGVELESKAAQTPFAREWEAATQVLMHAKEHPMEHLKEQLKEHLEEGRICHKRSESEAAQIEKITPGNVQEAVRRASHLLSDLVRLFKRDDMHPRRHKKPRASQGLARVRSEDSTDDIMFERALRSSLAEMRSAQDAGDSENAYDRAIQVGVEAAREHCRKSKSKYPQERSRPPSPSSGKRGENTQTERDKDEAEAVRLADEGVDDVTDYVIWRTLTEQRHTQGGNDDQSNRSLHFPS